jgi:hypothetical protein
MFGVSGLRVQTLLCEAGQQRLTLRLRLLYALWVLVWIVGHVLGGMAVGAALGWLGALASLPGLALLEVVLAGLCLLAALRQAGVLPLPLPQLHRQVPRHWMATLPWSVVALGYGLQLGSGVSTRIRVATVYAVLLCALFSGSALGGALLMGLFGLVRSLPPALLGPRLSAPETAFAFACRVDGHEPWVARLNTLSLCTAAVLLACCWWYGPRT